MLVLKYTIFAAISIGINLFFQYLSFLFYGDVFSLYVAMIFGSFGGLIVKYVLDKNWIFYYISKDKQEDVKRFILYSFMGVCTTILFWITEISFYYLVSNPKGKYLGAFVGLSVGYIIKYYLDKKYVFAYKGEETK